MAEHGSEDERMPPFATGELAGSYRLLFTYWEEAKRRGRQDLIDKSTLREDDYRVLREHAGRDAESVIDSLEDYFYDRVDPEVAVEAARRLGIALDPEDARRHVARLLAMWLLEAGDTWGIVRLRRR